MTTDTTAANKFYSKLFDWKLTDFEAPGMGKATLYGASNGNFGTPVAINKDQGIPSHWMTYIAVENVDETCKKVERLGGKVCEPPFDMPTIGRSAVINDPAGTAFHIFTPENKTDNMNMIGKDSGEICWMELMVDDPKPLFPFYGELFGWKVGEPMAINGGEYYSIEICGEMVGGFMKRPPSIPKAPPVWMPYVAVTSVDDFSAKATNLGAKLIMEKTEIPETGYFSLIEDPTGAYTYLFEWSGK